ncbi:MAG: AAA family ATPase [Planctomycetes bacterium]|nr:AAA family ATPase [Planctomycetota bacterium]
MSELEATLGKLEKARAKMIEQVRSVIIGQESVIEELVITLFARGHALIVGVPGLAKTLMVKTLASVLDLRFQRIQFTPDLMPADITGSEILDEDRETLQRCFRLIKGPVFTNVLLADEINRTPPKTQAALLEAMQEHKVTVSGATLDLPEPFFVLATQNPIEQEGTYPLPEAQLDRFMFSILITYPSKAEEVAIVKSTTLKETPLPKPVLSAEDILHIQRLVREVPVSDHVIDYATSLVRATRPHTVDAAPWANDLLSYGAGPRAAQYLVLGAKARAMLRGKYNVSAADVKAVAPSVLRHRLFTTFKADADGFKVEDVIVKLLDSVKEPSYGNK